MWLTAELAITSKPGIKTYSVRLSLTNYMFIAAIHLVMISHIRIQSKQKEIKKKEVTMPQLSNSKLSIRGSYFMKVSTCIRKRNQCYFKSNILIHEHLGLSNVW